MSTPSSAKPAAMLTIPLIYPQYNSMIHLSNIAMHFQNFSSNCIIIEYHLHSSLLLTFTPTMNSSQMEPRESVIFQPVLQAYPARHSCIITAHISLGNFRVPLETFSAGNLPEHNNFSDPWTNTHQHQHNYSLHSS